MHKEIENFFWSILVLTTLACLSGWFYPERYIGTTLATIAAVVGWSYVILDTLEVRRTNKRREAERQKEKRGKTPLPLF